MSKEPQACMNCGEPAMSCIGTVPLCPACSQKTEKRGVRVTGPKRPKKASSAPEPEPR